MIAVVKAARGSDLIDGKIGFFEEFACMTHPEILQIAHGRNLKFAAEFSEEDAGRASRHSAELFQDDFFGIVMFHIVRNGFQTHGFPQFPRMPALHQQDHEDIEKRAQFHVFFSGIRLDVRYLHGGGFR